jgi:SAM-dependent methyltransferase
MHSYAEFSDGVASDDYIPLIRELMAWDALCPNSNSIIRNELGVLGLSFQPSPLHWSRQKEWPWAIRESGLKPWDTCLDIGGSWSVFKYAVARRSRHVVCLDLEEEAITKSIESYRLFNVPRISHVQADCRDLPFRDESFDKVYALSVLEHMPSGHVKTIDEVLRVLRPGGVGMISMDLALEGKGQDNFYLGYAEVEEIIKHLNFYELPSRVKTNGARMKEGVVIAVVLMRIVK